MALPLFYNAKHFYDIYIFYVISFDSQNISIISDSYMMFNTASYQHAPLDKGQLISPGLPHSNYTYCLSFWTYMYSSTAGVPIGGLQVKVQKSDNSTLNLWRLDNHQASHWVQAQISMPDHFNTSDRVS